MCGGVAFLLRGDMDAHGTDFVASWMRVAEPARALACDAADPQTACEAEVVKLSLRNLMTFPWIAERVAAGTLALRGGTFDVRDGLLRWIA